MAIPAPHYTLHNPPPRCAIDRSNAHIAQAQGRRVRTTPARVGNDYHRSKQ